MVDGITDDMLIDAPSFDAVLSDLTGFIGDLPLVGHETEFLAHDYTIMEQGNEIAPVHKVWLSWVTVLNSIYMIRMTKSD